MGYPVLLVVTCFLCFNLLDAVLFTFAHLFNITGLNQVVCLPGLLFVFIIFLLSAINVFFHHLFNLLSLDYFSDFVFDSLLAVHLRLLLSLQLFQISNLHLSLFKLLFFLALFL